MKISIIVPVLNEIALIGDVLLYLNNTVSKLSVQWEVIVSDAGSVDGSALVVQKFCNKNNGFICDTVAIENPSIGKTIKKALQVITGELVLILPTDTRLEYAGFLELINRSQLNKEICGGFCKAYEPSTYLLNVYSLIQNKLRLKILKHLVWTNGIFFSKSIIKEIDFPVMGFLEDVYLSDFLRKNSNWIMLQGPLCISSRRYIANGVVERMVINLLVIGLFRLNLFSEDRLKRIYFFNKK